MTPRKRVTVKLSHVEAVRIAKERNPKASSIQIAQDLGLSVKQVSNAIANLSHKRRRTAAKENPAPIPKTPPPQPPPVPAREYEPNVYKERGCLHDEGAALRLMILLYGIQRSYAQQFSRWHAMELAWGDGPIPVMGCCRR